jgi:hypothetical protein
MRGRPLYRLASRVGLLRARLGLVVPGVTLALATWASLLVLSAIQRVPIDGSVTVRFQLGVSLTPAQLLADLGNNFEVTVFPLDELMLKVLKLLLGF